MNDEIVQYYIINKELGMSGEKMAVQVAHVCRRVCEKEHKNAIFQEWVENFDEKKILLGGKEKDLLKLIDFGFYSVRDLGLTEVPPDSLTCVGLPPMWKSEAQKFVKRLQLLK